MSGPVEGTCPKWKHSCRPAGMVVVGVGETYAQARRAACTPLWECSSVPTECVNIRVGLWTVNVPNGKMAVGPLRWWGGGGVKRTSGSADLHTDGTYNDSILAMHLPQAHSCVHTLGGPAAAFPQRCACSSAGPLVRLTHPHHYHPSGTAAMLPFRSFTVRGSSRMFTLSVGPPLHSHSGVHAAPRAHSYD